MRRAASFLGVGLAIASFAGGCGGTGADEERGAGDASIYFAGGQDGGTANASTEAGEHDAPDVPGSDGATEGDSATEAGQGDGGVDASFLPTLPQVVNFGGTVLTAPKVQPVLYSTDTGAADIKAFLAEITTTHYWSETTSEYGVGPLTILPFITLSTPPPATITIDTIEQEIVTNTTGANPAWGAADPGTIYFMVLPPGTIEMEPQFGNGACCTGYDGYHTEVAVDATTTVPFAVSCACPGFDGPGVTDLQERTVNMSHELVESATDPFPDVDPAFVQSDDADIVWTYVTGGEVADMCGLNDDQNYVAPGATYMVQRTWSNAQAKLRQNPCVPHATTDPYFNAFPQLGALAYTAPGAATLTTQAIQIPLGQRMTIDLPAYDPSWTKGAWTLTVYDYDYAFVGTSSPYLNLSLDSATDNGTTRHLTISPIQQDATLGGEAFLIYSEYGKAGDADYQNNISIGLVTN